MSYTLRPAITTEAKPLIGLYSESGRGKTKSALLIAKGFAGDMSKVAMVETEAGRGEVYAKDPVVGGYLVRPIRDNFAPIEYGKALTEVEKANMKVVIIDSASHEWEGANGVLGWAAKNQEEGKRGVLVWQQPKMSHQRDFILRLLQTPIPLVIVCMRAKYPMQEVEKNGKKEWQRSEQLEPKQSDDILFEMMVHGWIDKEHNFHGTKYTTDEFRAILVDKKPITVESGKRLAEWATGGIKQPESKSEEKPGESKIIPVTAAHKKEINALMKNEGMNSEDRLRFYNQVMRADDDDLAQAFISRFEDFYHAWIVSQMSDKGLPDEQYAPGPCPLDPEKTMLANYCENNCADREGCAVWA